MNRSRLVQLSVLVWLAVVWVLLWGDISIANIAGGFAVGFLVMVLMPLPRVPVEGRVHPVSTLVLLASIVYFALESSAQVAWLAIRPRPLPSTGVLRVQLQIRSDLVLVLCCDVINMIPGTMALEIDKARRQAYIHVLDAGSEAAVAKFYRSTHQLERLFINAFERDTDWQESRSSGYATSAVEEDQ